MKTAVADTLDGRPSGFQFGESPRLKMKRLLAKTRRWLRKHEKGGKKR